MNASQRAAMARAECAVQAIVAQTPQEAQIVRALEAIVQAMRAIAADQAAARQPPALDKMTIPMPQTRIEPGPHKPRTIKPL